MQPTPHEHETVLEVEAPRVKFGRGAEFAAAMTVG